MGKFARNERKLHNVELKQTQTSRGKSFQNAKWVQNTGKTTNEITKKKHNKTYPCLKNKNVNRFLLFAMCFFFALHWATGNGVRSLILFFLAQTPRERKKINHASEKPPNVKWPWHFFAIFWIFIQENIVWILMEILKTYDNKFFSLQNFENKPRFCKKKASKTMQYKKFAFSQIKNQETCE